MAGDEVIDDNRGRGFQGGDGSVEGQLLDGLAPDESPADDTAEHLPDDHGQGRRQGQTDDQGNLGQGGRPSIPSDVEVDGEDLGDGESGGQPPPGSGDAVAAQVSGRQPHDDDQGGQRRHHGHQAPHPDGGGTENSLQSPTLIIRTRLLRAPGSSHGQRSILLCR